MSKARKPKTSIALLEKKIDYHFNDSALLLQALTHSSYANEMRMNKENNNERLEFLGDAVLELVTSEYVFKSHNHLPEGDLTKLRASIVCEQSLSSCAKDLNIGDFLLLGKGEELSGGRHRESILSDALEAIIGAIYLDGGFTNAKEFVHKFILNNVEHKELFFDSKTILQEIIQNDNNKQKIRYKLISEEGPDHNKSFTIALYVGNEQYGCGIGKTKKQQNKKLPCRQLKSFKEVILFKIRMGDT